MKKDWLFLMESMLFKHRLLIWGLVAAVVLTLPFWGLSLFVMRTIIMIGVFAMLALGLNLLTGYTSQVSLGHAGFFAIGAYTSAVLMMRFDVHFLVGMLAGAALAGLFGLVLGIPTLRLSGSYLTIVTMGFGEIIRLIIMTWTPVTNGTLGLMSIPRPRFFGTELNLNNHGFYYLMVALVFLVALFCHHLLNSKVGRSFRAIGEDEVAASMMGLQTTELKVLAFVLSAFITGVAGVFYAPLMGFIDHNTFTFDVSILILSIVIVGGMGTLRGMFLGSAILIVFPEMSRFLMDWRFVVYGLLLILMMRFRPNGLLGWQSRLPYPIRGKKKEVKGHGISKRQRSF
ncbi:MAG: branched-chain amino acid ABC transporter permease [Turicibacter sp.]|nr:branched-chain amino acid ABC transporter permease [Turicibacter sp.]